MDFVEIISLNNDKHLCDADLLKVVFEGLLQIVKEKSSYRVDADMRNEQVSITLISKNDESLKINILLWKNWVNIYLGEYGGHYADDVKISGDKQLKEFIDQMNFLLKGDVIENIYYFGGDVKSYSYEFSYQSDKKKFSSVTFYPVFMLKRQTNTYCPWI